MFQEGPQVQFKISENKHLGISVTIGCPPGPQDQQNGVPGTREGFPKYVLQQSTCQQLLAARRIHFQLSPSLQ